MCHNGCERTSLSITNHILLVNEPSPPQTLSITNHICNILLVNEPSPSHTISMCAAELYALNHQFEPGASYPPTSIWHGMRPCRTSLSGLSEALNRMRLLFILIRLRAMSSSMSHLMDVRVSLPRMVHQHAQVVKFTPMELKNVASSNEFSNGAFHTST